MLDILIIFLAAFPLIVLILFIIIIKTIKTTRESKEPPVPVAYKKATVQPLVKEWWEKKGKNTFASMSLIDDNIILLDNKKGIVIYDREQDYPRVKKIVLDNGEEVEGTELPEITEATLLQGLIAEMDDPDKLRKIQNYSYECLHKGFAIIDMADYKGLSIDELKKQYSDRELKVQCKAFETEFASATVLEDGNIKVTIDDEPLKEDEIFIEL